MPMTLMIADQDEAMHSPDSCKYLFRMAQSANGIRLNRIQASLDDVPPNEIIHVVRGQSAGSHVDEEFVACACMRRKMMVIISEAKDMGEYGVWGYGDVGYVMG